MVQHGYTSTTLHKHIILVLIAAFVACGMGLLFSTESEAATVSAATRRAQIASGNRCGGINEGNNQGAGGLVVIYAAQAQNEAGKTAMTWNHGASVNIQTKNPKKGSIMKINIGAPNEYHQNVTLGPGQQSICPNETVLSGWGGNWAINCAHHLFNNGQRQKFGVQGQGVPKKANGTAYPAGGNWTTEIVSPRNGLTSIAVTTYKYKDLPPNPGWLLNPRTTRTTSEYVNKSQKNSTNFNHEISRQSTNNSAIAVRVTLRAIAYDQDGNIIDTTNAGITEDDGVVYKTFEGQNVPTSGFSRDSNSVTDNRSPIKDWGLGVGDTYCEWIRVNPDSDKRSDWDESTPQCIIIIGEWAAQSTQTVTRANGHGGTGSRGSGAVATAAGGSNAQYNDAWVGESYTLNNTLRNLGPDITESPILLQGWLVGMGSWIPQHNTTTNTPPGVGANQTVSSYSQSRTIIAADADQQTCSYIYWTPANSTDDSQDTAAGATSGRSCALVPSYYLVNPTVTMSGTDTLEQGRPAEFSGFGNLPLKDNSTGRYHTNSKLTTWTFKKRITKPDGTVETGDIVSGNKTFVPANGSASANKLADHTIDTAAYQVGTEVCISLTITEANHVGLVANSQEKCVSIVKSPKVQFQNADVRVGRDFRSGNNCGPVNSDANIVTTGTPDWVGNRPDRNMYGSWVEYGAFAPNTITAFGSAATPTRMSAPNNTPNKLTFANTTANLAQGVTGGQFNFNSQCQPDYFSQVEGAEPQNSLPDVTPGGDLDVDLANPDIANGRYVISGKNINIAGNIPAGKDITIYAKKDGSNGGKITVTGNIQYPDTMAGPNDIPRLKILADNDITVNSGVERIDAWLITKAALDTCEKKTSLVEGDCAVRLIINGPVSVGKLGLYRTYGSDATKPETYGKSAEVFNLRPDQILTQYFKENNTDQQKARSVYEVGLPPRY